ncbi:MAG: PHP domain-containing protein [Spirochaetes bacterium]|nr:PHP domain-containing protein [Spirochaetota bacterium]
MQKKIDLHIHSKFSEDGDLSIKEIFELAEKQSISAIAVADHDSIMSISAANLICAGYTVEYVPGVEITTVFSRDGSQQHILGYFIDEKSPHLTDAISKIESLRVEITRERIDALRKIGFALDEARIWKMADGRPPGATSITIEILENENNINDMRLLEYISGEKKDSRVMSFYRDYLTEGKPAYIPFRSLSVEEGISVIKKAGGIPVLAHPIFVKDRSWLDIIADSGIVGIEAVSTYHGKADIEFYIDYARRKNLLVTAGSDFHGPSAKPNIKLGGQEGMDYSYYERLKMFRDKGKR